MHDSARRNAFTPTHTILFSHYARNVYSTTQHIPLLRWQEQSYGSTCLSFFCRWSTCCLFLLLLLCHNRASRLYLPTYCTHTCICARAYCCLRMYLWDDFPNDSTIYCVCGCIHIKTEKEPKSIKKPGWVVSFRCVHFVEPRRIMRIKLLCQVCGPSIFFSRLYYTKQDDDVDDGRWWWYCTLMLLRFISCIEESLLGYMLSDCECTVEWFSVCSSFGLERNFRSVNIKNQKRIKLT